MKHRTTIFACLALLFLHLLITIEGNGEMILKTSGKKGKGGSIIILGKKCVPTLVKSGGKKGKDIIIVGNNHGCEKKQTYHKAQYIPIPVYHQYVHHKPEVKHEYSGYGIDYGMHDMQGYGGGGGDHGGYGGYGGGDHGYGHMDMGHLMGGYGGGHEGYGHEGYGHEDGHEGYGY